MRDGRAREQTRQPAPGLGTEAGAHHPPRLPSYHGDSATAAFLLGDPPTAATRSLQPTVKGEGADSVDSACAEVM
jgi:hypothetical protein